MTRTNNFAGHPGGGTALLNALNVYLQPDHRTSKYLPTDWLPAGSEEWDSDGNPAARQT